MSLADPITNFRTAPAIKDILDLHALCRQYVIERVLWDAALDCLKTFGLPEVLRRLVAPSSVMTAHSTEYVGEKAEETTDNFVKQEKTPVLPGKPSKQR